MLFISCRFYSTRHMGRQTILCMLGCGKPILKYVYMGLLDKARQRAETEHIMIMHVHVHKERRVLSFSILFALHLYGHVRLNTSLFVSD